VCAGKSDTFYAVAAIFVFDLAENCGAELKRAAEMSMIGPFFDQSGAASHTTVLMLTEPISNLC
jgi:hypothetical protein